MKKSELKTIIKQIIKEVISEVVARIPDSMWYIRIREDKITYRLCKIVYGYKKGLFSSKWYSEVVLELGTDLEKAKKKALQHTKLKQIDVVPLEDDKNYITKRLEQRNEESKKRVAAEYAKEVQEKKDLIAKLHSNFPDANEVDIEGALYYYAKDHYWNQASPLYSILSKTEYNPSKTEKYENWRKENSTGAKM